MFKKSTAFSRTGHHVIKNQCIQRTFPKLQVLDSANVILVMQLPKGFSPPCLSHVPIQSLPREQWVRFKHPHPQELCAVQDPAVTNMSKPLLTLILRNSHSVTLQLEQTPSIEVAEAPEGSDISSAIREKHC